MATEPKLTVLDHLREDFGIEISKEEPEISIEEPEIPKVAKLIQKKKEFLTLPFELMIPF